MDEHELKRWASIDKITDYLLAHDIRSDAWIGAFFEILAESEAQRTGKPIDDVRQSIRARQKEWFQSLLEKLESRDHGLAARIDPRNIEDVF